MSVGAKSDDDWSTSQSSVMRDQHDTEAAMERTRMKAVALKALAESRTTHARQRKRAHRDRAAYLQRKKKENSNTNSGGDFLLEEATRRVLDRLDDIKRPFKRILVIGGATVSTVRQLLEKRQDVEVVIVCDSSEEMLKLVKKIVGDVPKRKFDDFPVEIKYVRAFEDDLPIKDGVVDCVLSVLGLHWVNDLPGAMGQARCTRPGWLVSLRHFWRRFVDRIANRVCISETENEGGVSARYRRWLT